VGINTMKNLFHAMRCCRTYSDPRRFLRWMSACCPPDVSLLTSFLPGELSSVVGKLKPLGIWAEPEGAAAPMGKPVGRARAPWADMLDEPTPLPTLRKLKPRQGNLVPRRRLSQHLQVGNQRRLPALQGRSRPQLLRKVLPLLWFPRLPQVSRSPHHLESGCPRQDRQLNHSRGNPCQAPLRRPLSQSRQVGNHRRLRERPQLVHRSLSKRLLRPHLKGLRPCSTRTLPMP
jgi:hypothetical protein